MENEFSFIVIGDIQSDSRSPRSRDEDYEDHVLGVLDQVFDIAWNRYADLVIQVGDWFNRPSVPFPHVGNMVEVLAKNGYDFPEIFTVEGNHDLKYGSQDYREQSPLNILRRAGFVTYLPDNPVINDSLCRISGWHFVRDTEELEFTPDHENFQYEIGVFHQYHEEGLWDESETVDQEFYDQLDLAIFGHDHRMLQEETDAGTKVLLPGALTRMTSDINDMNREVSVFEVILRDSGIEIEQIPLDVPSIEEAYDQHELERQERRKSLDDYVSQLDRRDVDQSEDIEEMAKELSEDNEVFDVTKQELQKVGLI